MAECTAYITAFFTVSNVSRPLLADERIAIALAWLPNLMLTCTSVAISFATAESR